MSKKGEVHVDLSPEQWAQVKAALEGQIQTSVAYAADLEAENARLQQRGDGYKSESETSFARARRAEIENAHLQARVEEAEEVRRSSVNEVLYEKEAVEEKLRGAAAREGVLVRALRDALEPLDYEGSFAEWEKRVRLLIADTSPAAAALLAQGTTLNPEGVKEETPSMVSRRRVIDQGQPAEEPSDERP